VLDRFLFVKFLPLISGRQRYEKSGVKGNNQGFIFDRFQSLYHAGEKPVFLSYDQHLPFKKKMPSSSTALSLFKHSFVALHFNFSCTSTPTY
jgi:hypothetical protein